MSITCNKKLVQLTLLQYKKKELLRQIFRDNYFLNQLYPVTSRTRVDGKTIAEWNRKENVLTSAQMSELYQLKQSISKPSNSKRWYSFQAITAAGGLIGLGYQYYQLYQQAKKSKENTKQLKQDLTETKKQYTDLISGSENANIIVKLKKEIKNYEQQLEKQKKIQISTTRDHTAAIEQLRTTMASEHKKEMDEIVLNGAVELNKFMSKCEQAIQNQRKQFTENFNQQIKLKDNEIQNIKNAAIVQIEQLNQTAAAEFEKLKKDRHGNKKQ